MGMKIAVLMGGTSDERDVSLSSGAQVARALRQAGHTVVAVDTARGVLSPADEDRLVSEGVSALPPEHAELKRLDEGHTVALTRDPEVGRPDVFVLALHGGSGEDGTIQALLDVAGVAYTGSDRLGCSLAMDKEVTKRLLRDAGVPTLLFDLPRVPAAKTLARLQACGALALPTRARLITVPVTEAMTMGAKAESA